MGEADLRRFLEKVRQLQEFVRLSESRPGLRSALTACSSHQEVVSLARVWGFEIGRRWGEEEPPPAGDGNLLAGPCPAPGTERTEILLATPALRLERIHSCRAASPDGFWYDQEEHEWVVLLQGSARLRFEDEDGPRELNRGDALFIPAHRRHRLLDTDPPPGSVWLALFWREDGAG
ncbi:MAG: Nif11 domain/cupin domain-containing protein [Synechococcaceae cyanobacterium]|nr:Nif11 domain/cupin domain-containing protein [Synechococcaceae cyanobacterium]